MRRGVAALLAVLLLLLAGGTVALLLVARDGPRDDPSPGDQSGTPIGGASPAPTGTAQEAPDPALQPFYDQDAEWEDCGDHRCARIEVPLDYDEPEGERIELALLKNAADGRRVGSMVVNPGGPGVPGTDYAANAEFAFGEPLRDGFDIIGFDPRGTGESAAVDCLTDAQLDDYLAFDPDPETPDEVAGYVDWIEEFATSCEQKSGELALHVSTVEAARDMDIIRGVLGDDTLTYFGASYGTKLGATYAELFPDEVGRLVLDGAVDPSLGFRAQALQQAAGFETAISAYVDACVERPDCFLGDDRDQALDRITAFLDQVDAEPIPVGDRELAVGNAFYGLIAPLYNEDFWTFLDRALASAFRGDAALLLELSDLYTSRGDKGYTDNSSEAISVINCLDDNSSIPVSEVPSQYAAFERASPTFGRVFAWGLTGCQGRELGEQVDDIDAAGAAPILVIGTTRDPATPLRWAVALASQLESGILVKRDGDGHTGYNMGNACVDKVVEDYLLRGTVPPGDVDCPAA